MAKIHDIITMKMVMIILDSLVFFKLFRLLKNEHTFEYLGGGGGAG